MKKFKTTIVSTTDETNEWLTPEIILRGMREKIGYRDEITVEEVKEDNEKTGVFGRWYKWLVG